jgi:DNA-binding NtrC family response regulator
MARAADGELLKDARLLVVEDEAIIALDLEDMFREAGAVAVERCGTLRAAVSAIRERTPTAAVLDIRLGQHTTARLVELLVADDIPFIFYSGQAIPSSIREKSPDAILVSKPGKKKLLVQTIVDLIERRREQRERAIAP